jgi:DNA-binding transcriptional MerR regulator
MSDAGAGHQSIGEVLALLKEDFPDVTISKIRFLESQGLIHPERTASGYRKFFDADVDQLRWILRQQRDNFLPLKVIKKMLEDGTDRLDPGLSPQPTLWTQTAEGAGEDPPPDPPPPRRSDDHDTAGSEPSPRHPTVIERRGVPGTVGAVGTQPGARSGAPPPSEAATDDRPAPPAESAPSPAATTPADRTAGTDGDPVGDDATGPTPHESEQPVKTRHETPADVVAALQEAPPGGGRRRAGRAPNAGAGPLPGSRSGTGGGPGGGPRPPAADDVTAEELQHQTGITPELLAALEQFGLVETWSRGGESVFGGDAVSIARLAVRYAEMGVEPRHLRMYKVAAEREAGFIEQLAVPFLKQRNPTARSQAADLSGELERMGADLHAVLLRRELGPDLGG